MDIIQSPAGDIVQAPSGYRSFVPHRLPPPIVWDQHLADSLSRANFMLGKLAHEGSKLTNPYLFIRPFMAREAVLSSKIEGTHTTLGEILAADVGGAIKQDPDDLQEVQNYIKALDYAVNRLHEPPLSLRLITEIHETLMQGVRGAHAAPGQFRRVQNWIGAAGATVHTARFVPPSPEYMQQCLHDFEQFLHDRQLPPLIHVALCHYQFEAIHPFLDGNGRVGRLLIILLLMQQDMIPSPMLYTSAFFEATKSEYYQRLYQVSADGAWNAWLIYFLRGVALQSEDVLSRVTRINTLLNHWKKLMASSGSSISLSIIEILTRNPYITVTSVATALSVAYSTAQRGIKKLEQAGIIHPVNKKQRDKMYCATALLDILEEQTKLHTVLHDE